MRREKRIIRFNNRSVRVKALAVGLFLAVGPAFAQAGSGMVIRTPHFEIYDNSAGAQAIARQMETRYSLYDQIFRFSRVRTTQPLKVRIYEKPEQYAEYMMSRVNSVPPGAIYLHHQQEEHRELVICIGSNVINDTLPYQAFLQFLHAFVHHPPLWIKEGFAEYFSTIEFNEEGELLYEENLLWLPEIKRMGKLPKVAEIMNTGLSGQGAPPENFTGLAWSLVSFFLNSGDGDYLRSMTESFMLLSDEKTAEENAAEVMNRVAAWNNMEQLEKDYVQYIYARKSFNEYILEGEAAYAQKKADDAEIAFLSALELKPGNYIPFYYLGLLSYDAQDNKSAEGYYKKALDCGGDVALITYALGLNAAAVGRQSEAVTLLRKAASIDPDRFKVIAEAVIIQLGE